MKRFFRTLFSPRLWSHLALIAVAIGIVIGLTMWWLQTYTRHGESLTVPDLQGMALKDVQRTLQNLDLNFEVTDSIYSNAYGRGVVVIQNPEPNRLVKRGRTVFLSVNSILPEMVQVPDLRGRSLRIARPLLDISGLEIGGLEYVPDESCTDCVVGLTYKGEAVKAGDKLRKGEKVVLVLGRRSNEETSVPSILGLDFSAAQVVIQAASLNVGQIISCDGCETSGDTLAAFVVNQIPNKLTSAPLGSNVDVFLSTDPSVAKAFDQPIDTMNYEMD